MATEGPFTTESQDTEQKPRGAFFDSLYDGPPEYKNVALDTEFEGVTPDLIYSLMFTDRPFLTTFLENTEHVKDLELGQWTVEPEPKRESHYVKPINGPIGPHETRCDISEVQERADPTTYYTTVTTAHTPDVPSGDNFAVLTRTIITPVAAGVAAGSRVRVTTEVDWKKVNVILRGIIERNALQGSKDYHTDLENAIRDKMAAFNVRSGRPTPPRPLALPNPAGPTFAVADEKVSLFNTNSTPPSAALISTTSIPRRSSSTWLVVLLTATVLFLALTNFWTLVALRHQARLAHACLVKSRVD